MRYKLALRIGMSALLLAGGNAVAGDFDWGQGDNRRFRASLGGYLPTTSTTLRVDDPDGVNGTKISAEDDLGLDDRETLPWLDMRIRLSRRNLIDITYYDLSRSGAQTLQFDITFEGETYTASTEVDSFFNSKIWRIAYGYSFMKDNKRELGLLFGLHVTDIEVGINETTGGQSSRAEGTAPLPSFGIQGSVELPKRWRFRGWGQVFALDFEDFKGSLVNVTATVEHDTFKHVGFGFGWSYFGFDLEADASDLDGEFDYNFGGPNFYMNIMF
jgi:hypothetical protein